MTIPIAEVIRDLSRAERGDITIPALIALYQSALDQDLDALVDPEGTCAFCGKPLSPDAEPWFTEGICYLCALSRD